jgi:nucleoside-diphosphate-sugar epimerase
MAPQTQNPLLPAGSLILVTAANGYIASHIVDQLLLLGYAVRGTVRSLSKSSWMKPLYESRHPNPSFSLVEVPDILAEDCWSDALKGVSAVIHTAAINTLEDDTKVILQSIQGNIAILESVAKVNLNGGQIKRVVLTSSSWSVMYPQPNKEVELTTETYNTETEIALSDPDTPKEARGLLTYATAKVKGEQESWKWWAEHGKEGGVGFVLNTIQPSTCIGEVLAPKEQPYPSTAGFVRSLYDGDRAFLFEWLEPQWFIDVTDAACLHIAATILDGIEEERVFGYTEPYTWVEVQKVLEDEMGRKCGASATEKGRDLSKPTKPMERSSEIFERMGRTWKGFDGAVRRNIRSYYPD